MSHTTAAAIDWALVVGALGPFLVAAFTARLGYRDWRRQQHEERAERKKERDDADAVRRKAVATTWLTELRWVERLLRQLYDNPQAGAATTSVQLPMRDRFDDELPLFDPPLIRQLVEFRGLVQDLTLAQKLAGERPDVITNPQFHHFVRVKAGFALQQIPWLKRELEGVGGLEIAPERIQIVKYPGLPELPAPAFPLLDETTFTASGGATALASTVGKAKGEIAQG